MRVVICVGAALAAGFACAAKSQDIDVTALQMKACTLIKDDAARVRCYDRTMGRPVSEPSLVAIPQSAGGGALVPIPQPQTPAKSESLEEAAAAAPQAPAKPEPASVFDVRSIVRAITPSGSMSLGSAEPKGEQWQALADKPVLQEASRLVASVDSTDGKAKLVLQCKDTKTEAYVTTQSFLGWESVRVLYRVNDGPMTENRWSTSADARSAVAGNPMEFINSLADRATLFVRISDYNETNHDMTFALGSVSNLRSQLSTVCRWPGAFPEEKLASEHPVSTTRQVKPKAAPLGPSPLKLH
jgi:hypothetical protein